jgi:hypothetical protein
MWGRGGGREEGKVQQDNQSPNKGLKIQEVFQAREGGSRFRNFSNLERGF